MANGAGVCAGLITLAWAAAAPGWATCAVDPQGSGHVGAIVDGRTLRLADGREVRLTGLAYPVGPHAAAALAAMAGDRDVVLRGQDDAPDRYGRQSFFVFPDGAGVSVQAALLARGEAVSSGLVTDPGCAAELGQAETAARAARLGVWADPDAIKSAERPGDILALTGQFAVVEGKVVSVRQAGPTFYVNFGRRWTEGFAVTISGRMMAAFEAAGVSPRSLENRWVRVRGWVERHGGPRMDLFRTGQIELIAGR
jgi:endonuclease YncB( thermonuclease family)